MSIAQKEKVDLHTPSISTNIVVKNQNPSGRTIPLAHN